MDIDSNTLNQIAYSLAEHYLCIYYVNINSGRYIVFNDKIPRIEKKTEFPEEGDNFFTDAVKNAAVFIHPDDLDLMINAYKKETMLAKLSKYNHFTVSFRARTGDIIKHMRHVVIMCRDKKHAICCLEDIEAEFLEKEEQMRKLQSAKLLARTDELTGVKNSTAFKEYVDKLDEKIAAGKEKTEFAIVMCDINDLKQTNDTRGHNSGDEEIQATSQLICDTFQHSPVFRIGGDEFVVILTDKDYEQREFLITVFRDVAETNRRNHKGPDVASGIAIFRPESGDTKFSDVFKRADRRMYENKNATKVKGS